MTHHMTIRLKNIHHKGTKTQLDVDKKRVIDKVQKSVKNVAIIVKNRYFQNMEGKDRTFGAKIAKKIDYNCKSTNIVTRPNAGNGLWLCILIPLSYMINTFNKGNVVHFDYKLTTILAFGLFLQTVEIYLKLATDTRNVSLNILFKLIPGLFTSFLVWICLKQAIVFSLLCGLSVLMLYNSLYFIVLRKLPKSFSLGEAAIVIQGTTLFLFNCFLQLPIYSQSPPTTNMSKIHTILQIGLLGVLLLIGLTHYIKFIRNRFLFGFLVIIVSLFVLFIPIMDEPPLIFVLKFVFQSFNQLLIMIWFILLLVATLGFVIRHLKREDSSSTSLRKIFHIIIVLAFVPALMHQCSLLYLATGIALALFLMLETTRIIKIEPFSEVLESVVVSFVDEKDAGIVAATPIYLLIGFSLPLWLHPYPCDITDSAGFELVKLLAGVLSVGIGDTAASVFGSKFGFHKWQNSSKSVEGTLAGVFSQLLAISFLFYFGYIIYKKIYFLTLCFAIILNVIIEAKTDQVDNLILPLVTFIVLSTL